MVFSPKVKDVKIVGFERKQAFHVVVVFLSVASYTLIGAHPGRSCALFEKKRKKTSNK